MPLVRYISFIGGCMAKNKVIFSRVSEEVEMMAKQLAEADERTISSLIAWLIRQEWLRRQAENQREKVCAES